MAPVLAKRMKCNCTRKLQVLIQLFQSVLQITCNWQRYVPFNERLGIFLSLVIDHQILNITFLTIP